jgi:hypothetical protein
MKFPEIRKSGIWYEIEGRSCIVLTTSIINAISNWIRIFIQDFKN